MLEIRPTCENCNKALLPDSTEAMICTYECTFCRDCVEQVLENVCPNCGGGFKPRPVRPKEELLKNKASNSVVYKPVKMDDFKPLLKKLKNIEPHKR